MSLNYDLQACKEKFKKLQLGVFSRKNSAFLAPLLCSLKVKFIEPEELGRSKDHFYMGVDGETIFINPYTFLNLSQNDGCFILEHELWHIARLHNERQGNRNPRIWNYACDYVINQAMIDDGSHCGIQGLWGDEFRGKSEEEIYDELIKNAKKVKGWENEGDVLPPDTNSNTISNTAQLLGRLKQQLQMSNPELCSDKNSLVGSMLEIWTKFLAPKLPWENILHNCMKDILPKAHQSWKRRNRRFMNIHLPSMVEAKDRLGHLVYAIDTSGSVTEEQLNRINSEIKYIHDKIKPKLLTVIQFDEEIQHTQVFKYSEPYEYVTLHGGGGTDYAPVKKFIDDLDSRPDGLIIFTDLYCKPMEPLNDTSIPVFWVAVNTNLGEEVIPFGTYIPVEV